MIMHGGGDFSHAYVSMHKYFDICLKKKWYISFYIQFNMFSCMKISYTFCLGATNSKPNE
jgi:hypothetical protein